ncbi:MAG: class I SAM-dependent methyltransferase [Acidobacteriia bacterium]|nr:class I SAM-dependent methyltransferase [Terriglobia bacterium]
MPFRFFRRNQNAAGSLEQALEQLRTSCFFAPTPWAVARQMLELAEVEPQDMLYDLGSGDGRIPIMAAQEFGCRAVGIELDEKLRQHSAGKATEYGLAEQVTFRGEDFFKTDLRDATVVTLYLLTSVNGHLGPRLASQLRKGARVVSLDYEVPGWRAEKSIPVKSEGDVDYVLHLYRR